MMRPSDFSSPGEYYRAHRQALLLSIELGCTPIEAEFEIKRREAIAENGAARARLQAKMAAPLPSLRSAEIAHDPVEQPDFYWKKD